MPVFHPYTGLVNVLKQKTDSAAAAPWSARLFTSPATWSLSTVVADLVEATFPGYAPVNLTTWSPPLIFDAVRALSKTDPLVYTVSTTWAGETIVGVYVTDPLLGLIALAELPGGPQEMKFAGDSITISVNLTDQNPSP